VELIEEVGKLLRITICPSAEDLVAVYYGGYALAPEKRPPERWVDEHVKISYVRFFGDRRS
jgi:hypothetical protein